MFAEGPDALRQFHRTMALEDALSAGLGLPVGAVEAGYDHQGFVRGLAGSRCCARLRSLEFADYAETYLDGWREQRTPRDDLLALFTSTGLPSLRRLTLAGTALDASERDALLATPLGR